MKEVRGGPPDTVRARGLMIEAPAAIAPVNTSSVARLQGARGHQRLVRTTGSSLRETRSAELRRLQRARYVQRIWPLGEKLEFELIEKLIEHFGLDEDAVSHILDRFAGLDPNVLRALGADRLPASPIRSVGEGRL
jgi:hypothetical protein